MDEDANVRLDTRLAGQVTRYHTWPRVREQTVAEHSWNLCRIYFSIEDNPDPKFLYHLIFHDIGENTVGDLPYPVKRDNPDLKEIVDMLEHRSFATQLDFWGAFQYIGASEIDTGLFKQLELVEMAEWGMDELCLGNSHGYVIVGRCLNALGRQAPCTRLIEYVIQRLNLFNNQHVWLREEPWCNVERWKDKLNERSKQSTTETSRRKSL